MATGMALGSENLVRLTFGLTVIVLGASVDLYAAAIVTGALVILGWPRAVRFDGPAVAGVSAFAFLGNVAGGTVIAQSVLTGGPVVLSLVGGQRSEVTSLFAALALFRAPYIVALGLAIRVTAHLTDLVTSGRRDELDRVRRRLTVAGTGLAVLGGAGAAVLGPPVLRIVFGSDIELSRVECAVLAAGSLLALSTLGLTLVQMVRSTGERVLRAWLLALAVGVVAIVALPLDPLPLVVWAFLASEVTAFAAMAVGYRPRP